MPKSEFSFKKVGGYILIGFFVVIIVISFGMPDFLSRMGGGEQGAVVVINGQRIQGLEYVRFRDNLPKEVQEQIKKMDEKDVQRHLLDALISNRLQQQMAAQLGITVSASKVREVIATIPAFRNELKEFDMRLYARYLDHYRFTKQEYFYWMRDNLTTMEMARLIEDGIAVSPDEVVSENTIENSQIQVKYCFASNWSLKQRFKQEVAVADAEVDAEMSKSRSADSDATARKAAIRADLEQRKFDAVRRKLVGQIADMARLQKSFDEAARFLGGDVGTSAVFKIGDTVNPSDKKNTIASLTESKVFSDDCLVVEMGKTSRAVDTIDGIYVFTPVKREVAFAIPDDEARKNIEKRLAKERLDSTYGSLLNGFAARSKIIRNPKFM